MSVEQLKLAFDADLSGTAKPILICLAWHAREDGTDARPSVATMARETGFSVRAVRDAVRQLQAVKWIKPEATAAGKPTSYRLTIPRRVAPRHQPPTAPAAVLTPAPAAVTPAPAAVTPAPAAANSPKDMKDSGARATPGSPHGPGAPPGQEMSMTPEQVAAARLAAKAAAREGAAAAKAAAPSPIWGRHPPTRRVPLAEPNPIEIENRRREAAALLERLASGSDVPRGTDSAKPEVISAARPGAGLANSVNPGSPDGPAVTIVQRG